MWIPRMMRSTAFPLRRTRGEPLPPAPTPPLTGELTSITFNDDGFTPSISSRYNHLGQLTQIDDAAGTRTFTYNQYNEQETETTAGLAASVLTLRRDGVGRPAGYCLGYAGAAALQTA